MFYCSMQLAVTVLQGWAKKKVSRVFYYIGTKLLSRMLWSSASRPLRSVERTCVRIGGGHEYGPT